MASEVRTDIFTEATPGNVVFKLSLNEPWYFKTIHYDYGPLVYDTDQINAPCDFSSIFFGDRSSKAPPVSF